VSVEGVEQLSAVLGPWRRRRESSRQACVPSNSQAGSITPHLGFDSVGASAGTPGKLPQQPPRRNTSVAALTPTLQRCGCCGLSGEGPRVQAQSGRLGRRPSRPDRPPRSQVARLARARGPGSNAPTSPPAPGRYGAREFTCLQAFARPPFIESSFFVQPSLPRPLFLLPLTTEPLWLLFQRTGR
jgi:hypothetical protein